MSAIRIESCRVEEIPRLQTFIDTRWRKDHVLARDAALLTWQYDASRVRPLPPDELAILLAWDDEEIVGMLGYLPFWLNVEGQRYPGAWLSQWLVAPEARSAGVGLRLLWAVKNRGFDAMFVLGFNENVQRIYASLQYEILDDLPRWIGIVDYEAACGLMEAAGGERAAVEAYGASFVLDGQAGTIPHPWTVRDWQDDWHELWDAVWRRDLAPYWTGGERDAAYLTWRYGRHPSFHYQLRGALNPKSGRLRGLTVSRVEPILGRQEKVLRVLEFLATPEAEAALAHDLIDLGRREGVCLIDFYCSAARAAQALHTLGFRKSEPQDPRVVFPTRLQPMEPGHYKLRGAFWLTRSVRAQTGKLLARERFYVTKSDGDQDRPNQASGSSP